MRCSFIAVVVMQMTTAVSALNNPETAIRNFERNHSEVCVIIAHPDTLSIEYIYNENKCVNYRISPGSLAKIWSAGVFMSSVQMFGFNPAMKINCSGKYYFTSEIDADAFAKYNLQRDNDKIYVSCSLRAGHGDCDLGRAISHSCNLYFLTFAGRKPDYFFNQLIDLWKLDKPTGYSHGKISENEYRITKNGQPWELTLAAIGEGHILKVTPLKIIQTYAALWSGTGLLVPSYKGRAPYQQNPLELDASIRNQLQSSLRRVVGDGTLKKLDTVNKNITIMGGKTGTGTSNNSRYSTHGMNVIFFKHRNIEYVMLAYVTKGSGKNEALDLSMVVLNAL